MDARGAVTFDRVEHQLGKERMRQLAREPVKGAIPRVWADGTIELIPWQESTMLGGQKRRKRWNPKVMVQNVEVPQAMVEQMQAQLPPVIRREPRERLKVLVQRMVEDAMRSKRQFGYVRWPASVEKELRAVGWREGEPDLVGKIEEAAARLMEVAANRQRMSDQRKATLDWHGHYNA